MADNDGPVTFSDLGITTQKAVKETFFGKVRSFQNLKKLEIAFVVVSILGILSVIAIAIARMITDIRSTSADFTFALLLIMNAVFCLTYVLSGVYFERATDIVILITATGIVWLYIVLNYAVGVQDVYKMVRLIISSVFSPVIIVVGFMISRDYQESNNLIFRTVGAQQALQDMCKTIFIWISLLKADLQVSCSLAILILTSGHNLDLEDKIVLPLAATFALASCVTGYLGVRLENRSLAIAYAALWIIMPGYAIYLIVMSVTGLKDADTESLASKSIIAVTFVASAISLVVRSAILLFGIKVYLNFGKGLKERMFGHMSAEQAFEQQNAPDAGSEQVS